MESPEAVREYRKHRKSPGQLGRVLPVVVLALFFVVQSLRRGDPLARSAGAVLLVLAVGAVFWVLRSPRQSRTLVDSDGVTVHGAFLARRIPWSEIYELDVRKVPKGERTSAFVRTVNGRRRPLPQVNDWQVEELRAEVAAIRKIGTRYGARTWERVPEVEQTLRRRAGREHSLSHGVLRATAAWGVMFAVWVVLQLTGQGPFTNLLLLWGPVAAFVCFLGYAWQHWEPHVPAKRDSW
ncbi:PH domain-containing protein [Streptomyces sp. NPDC047000]|uniref:PH domain-containing protein n=1 Tax=Streptomyces sp. NPDC047000 TaxID=3155474 RepID=UPI00341005F7